ncbi:hypothetical protein [Noviherbaspirillum galbum]|uniref:hypothetical protein n=1 Tax=Noviherbaspirillum galbum TaxID=2709383 RepID=UPI001969D903|nr:hypothetical protein [Noviherbaspirillum galbum]
MAPARLVAEAAALAAVAAMEVLPAVTAQRQAGQHRARGAAAEAKMPHTATVPVRAAQERQPQAQQAAVVAAAAAQEPTITEPDILHRGLAVTEQPASDLLAAAAVAAAAMLTGRQALMGRQADVAAAVLAALVEEEVVVVVSQAIAPAQVRARAELPPVLAAAAEVVVVYRVELQVRTPTAQTEAQAAITAVEQVALLQPLAPTARISVRRILPGPAEAVAGMQAGMQAVVLALVVEVAAAIRGRTEG